MVAVDDAPTNTHFSEDDKIIFPVDAEHTGIRTIGCLSLFANGIVIFLLAGILTDLPAIVVILGSLILASAISYGLEKYLVHRWTSGRTLEITQDSIALVKKGEVEREIDPQHQVNVLAWNFIVKRSSRVKKGWHVIGMSLEQDSEYIPVYTFASPEDFEEFDLAHHFTTLQKEKKSKDEKLKSVGNMRLAGEQRRLHEAEYDRGIFGAEVTYSQFLEYVEHLQKNYAKWMLS